MPFRTSPNLGPQLGDTFSGIPFYDGGPNLTEASYRLGNTERGNDGGTYFFVRASADIAATSATGTQVTVTYPAYTVAAGAGGMYTPPDVAVKAGDYLHVRRGAYNALPT